MIETAQPRIEAKVLGALLLVNVAVHFIPFARPGFHADDFFLLQFARLEPWWDFVGRSLAQPTRPLGWLLYILTIKVFGLNEPAQLMVLIATTSLLTTLVYVWLVGALPRKSAGLAALAFVVWPVKHEIYSTELFGAINLAGCLIVASGLFYRRWTQTSRAPSLLLSLTCYGASILIYEIGYLAPLVFFMVDRPARGRRFWPGLFVLPAALYWALRVWHPSGTMGNGFYQPSLELLKANLLSSLPSNLVGYQVLRNTGYGLWGVIDGPLWLQVWCTIAGLAVGYSVTRLLGDAGRQAAADVRWKTQAACGLIGAALVTLPAATILVESRHSILAAIGMGVVVGTIGSRLWPFVTASILVVLQLSTQGLAWRQVELSQLQSRVHGVIQHHGEEIRSSAVVVINMESLADRLDYTWGERSRNVLRAYWGLPAFSTQGFRSMVADAVYPATDRMPSVQTCARGLVAAEDVVTCEQDYSSAQPFETERSETLIIDFKTMPLPESLTRNASTR